MNRNLKAMESPIVKRTDNLDIQNEDNLVNIKESELVEDETSIYEYDCNCLKCKKRYTLNNAKRAD